MSKSDKPKSVRSSKSKSKCRYGELRLTGLIRPGTPATPDMFRIRAHVEEKDPVSAGIQLAPTENSFYIEATANINTFDNIRKWLDAVEDAQAAQEPENLDSSKLYTSLDLDSDCEWEEKKEACPVSTNPFAKDMENMQEEDKLEAELLLLSPSSGKTKMRDFIRCIESREAVPQYALNDAVFNLDKPNHALSLGENIDAMALPEDCQYRSVHKIFVTEVYSPFQFWFQFANGLNDANMLSSIDCAMHNFYFRLNGHEWSLPRFFMQTGYICAIGFEGRWRRARIVEAPPDSAKISVYCLDYGSVLEVPAVELYFLHRQFAEHPALAARGTLSHIHPLGLHWSLESIAQFSRQVLNKELYAIVQEIDAQDRIVTMKLSLNATLKPNLTVLLVDAKLAGYSTHFSKLSRDHNCGRRLRYLRERLPTFDMLESQAFPTLSSIAAAAQDGYDFEDEFDDIIYSPTFFKYFEPPQLQNPFRLKLQKALANWLLKFKEEELAWKKKFRARRRQLKLEQELKLLEYEKNMLEKQQRKLQRREVRQREKEQKKLQQEEEKAQIEEPQKKQPLELEKSKQNEVVEIQEPEQPQDKRQEQLVDKEVCRPS